MLHSRRPTATVRSGTLYRHGDVLLRSLSQLPRNVQRRSGATLAEGELTGHSHRLDRPDAIQLWIQGETLFLEVKTTSVRLIHEEHQPIELLRGIYQVWRQREYRPDAYVEVSD